MKDGTKVLIGLGAGLAGGIAIAVSGNPQLLRFADMVAPIGTLWVNAIRMTVVPLVVALLITGVASAADLRAIGRLGGRTLLVFFLLLLGTAIIVVPLAPMVFRLMPGMAGGTPPLPAGAAEAAGAISTSTHPTDLGSWLVSLIPTNPIAAAADGAMLQLIVFTLLLALAIARTPPAARETLLAFFRALTEAMLVLVRWIVGLAPIGVFGLLLPLAAHAGAGLAGAVGFYILVYSAGSIAVILLLYPVAAVAGGVSIRRFGRAALAPQLIAFSSSSSIASLPALVESAEDGLGLPDRVTGFVLPLAVSTFHIAAPVSWSIGALFVAAFYGISLGFAQLATIAFAAIFLAFAAPGVPRGAFLMLAPLFIAVGLPVEGIGILIAVDAIPDLFSTVLNVTGDLAAAVIVGRHARDNPDAVVPPAPRDTASPAG